jgi:hypothetical protein
MYRCDRVSRQCRCCLHTRITCLLYISIIASRQTVLRSAKAGGRQLASLQTRACCSWVDAPLRASTQGVQRANREAPSLSGQAACAKGSLVPAPRPSSASSQAWTPLAHCMSSFSSCRSTKKSVLVRASCERGAVCRLCVCVCWLVVVSVRVWARARSPSHALRPHHTCHSHTAPPPPHTHTHTQTHTRAHRRTGTP